MKNLSWLLVIIPLAVVVFFIVSWIIQVSYNNSIALMFDVREITFHQACWLNTLSFLLFRNISVGSSK